MKFHKYADLFPMMSQDEYTNLLNDIRQNGYDKNAPITVFNGEILDGRNRWKACQELGVKPPMESYYGNDPLGFVIRHNLHRRHLTSSQAAAISAEAEGIYQELQREADERKKATQIKNGEPPTAVPELFPEPENDQKTISKIIEPEIIPIQKNGDSRDQLASLFGTNGKYVDTAVKLKKEAPDLHNEVKQGQLTIPQAKREFARREKREKRSQEVITLSSPNIIFGNMAEVGSQIEDSSVDFILTDPPYPNEYLHLFSELSKLASRVLKPGGLCLVYSGQIHLPEIYQRLGENLEYLWTFAIRHTGGVQRIFKANVNTGWKPVLGFVKPPIDIYWDSFIDITSGGREKEDHAWQQAESESAYFIEKLTIPNAVVLDPFCGSGTVLVAAKRLSRQYIGIDNDKEAINRASKRLNNG